MNTKPKPPCVTLYPWLKANLGPLCLSPLTGTDARALSAAVQIIDLYSYCHDPAVLEAFGKVVECMQSTTQELAYHAIAHVLDWGDRERLWALAGLEPLGWPAVCAFEPGGSQRPGEAGTARTEGTEGTKVLHLTPEAA